MDIFLCFRLRSNRSPLRGPMETLLDGPLDRESEETPLGPTHPRDK